MSGYAVTAENDKDADFCDIAALCDEHERRRSAMELTGHGTCAPTQNRDAVLTTTSPAGASSAGHPYDQRI
jgi:hypothetical protein